MDSNTLFNFTMFILPKYTKLHGEVFATVYLQILMHSLSNKVVSLSILQHNTGYNERVISNILKILSSSNIINLTKYRGMLIVDINDKNLKQQITSFNNALINKDYAINQSYLYDIQTHNSTVNDLIKYISLESKAVNSELLLDFITHCEKIQKGSSLLIVNLIVLLFLNSNKVNISQSLLALLNGSSQSTIHRYITKYTQEKILEMKNKNITFCKSTNEMLDKIFYYNEVDEENFDEEVVEDMEDEKLCCPLCNRKFAKTGLVRHVSSSDDVNHALLAELRKKNKSMSIQDIYETNIEKFNINVDILGIEIKEEETIADDYLKVECSCKMTCKECYINWKSDFYNDCDQERKMAFEQEYRIGTDNEVAISTTPAKPARMKKTASKSKSNVKKEDVVALLGYFYSGLGKVSPNKSKEYGQIRNLLAKGHTVYHIKLTMDYLKERNSNDLRFLNNSIEDVILEQNYLNEVDKYGTAPYLVKMYYEGFNLPINKVTFVKDVKRIQDLLNGGLTFDQVETTVKYMIQTKCPTFNFVGSKVTEALTKYKAVSNVHNNPAFYDRDDMTVIRSDLKSGRARIDRLNPDVKDGAIQFACELFKKNEFEERYSHFEWAFKIGLELNEELYSIGSSQSLRESFYDKVINDKTASPETRQKAMQKKEEFSQWLNGQIQKIKKSS